MPKGLISVQVSDDVKSSIWKESELTRLAATEAILSGQL